jgi:hypothetical protein
MQVMSPQLSQESIQVRKRHASQTGPDANKSSIVHELTLLVVDAVTRTPTPS